MPGESTRCNRGPAWRAFASSVQNQTRPPPGNENIAGVALFRPVFDPGPMYEEDTTDEFSGIATDQAQGPPVMFAGTVCLAEIDVEYR